MKKAAVRILQSALLLCGFQAGASYVVSSPNNIKTINYGARSHIVISGRGSDLMDLPMQAALAKGLRIHEIYPNEQVIIYNVTTPDDKGHQINPDQNLHRFPVTVISNSNSVLTGAAMLRELLKYGKIASLNHFGHSGIDAGAFMDGVGEADTIYAMTPFLSGIGALAKHFTPDAYAIFHGCNSGHLMAVEMSRQWKIPVAGGFSTAHFEQPYVDLETIQKPDLDLAPKPGVYYWSNDTMAQLHAQVQKTRMKSDDVSYIGGFYGTYMQALPIYKFFCATPISDERCAVGIAKSVMTVVTPLTPDSGESFKDYYGRVVREWLCPSGLLDPLSPARIQQLKAHNKPIPATGSTYEIQPSCMEFLAQLPADRTALQPEQRHYMPFRSPHSLQCNLNLCYPASCMVSAAAMDTCVKAVQPTVVSMRSGDKSDLFPDGIPQGSSTFVDEYYLYLNAFDQLQKDDLGKFFTGPLDGVSETETNTPAAPAPPTDAAPLHATQPAHP